MNILKSWLADYVKIDVSDEELSDQLNLSGTAVDAVIRQIDPKIIVAQIKEVNPHPNADRLQIAKVFTGIEELQIVCGAPNIAAGQKVPLAMVGAKLSDFEIKPAEIRGVESFGMMCSERELGLSNDHAGIKILDENFELGKSLSDYLTGDAVFEIEITPNRGDCLSHFGVAREVAAVTGHTLQENKEIELIEESDANVSVDVKESVLCPQYVAIPVNDVKVAESPEWLKKRLMAMGAKPINNIVDITNYIMLDLGQPLHAFDAEKVNQGIVVRLANDGEELETLDNVQRKLSSENLVIADNEKAIALAGVMGGKNSEVSENTKNIIIEAAEFEAKNIRATAKNISLSTEASYRFERGIDSSKVIFAAEKAAKMIAEIAGGKVGKPTVIGQARESQKIDINYEGINKLLGIDIDKEEVNQILTRLGFKVENNIANSPLWRHDVSCWQDLAEEVGRIYGYNKIEKKKIDNQSFENGQNYFKKEAIKDRLCDIGFSEVINYIFLSENDIKIAKLSPENLLEVKNPAQKENKYLRNSLIPVILKNIAKNPSFDSLLFFEIGKVFNKDSEKIKLACLASGKNAKDKIEEAGLLISEITKVDSGNLEIKELTRDELNAFKIKKPVVYAFEIDLSDLLDNINLTEKDLALNAPVREIKYKKVSKYPSLTRDIAFILSNDTDSDLVAREIENSSDKILFVEKFDEFSSDKFGLNMKNIAFHVFMQDLDRAMTDDEANVIVEKIIDNVGIKFKAQLRK